MEAKKSPTETKKSLFLKFLPPKYTRRQTLKSHFEKYGEVVQILVNAERKVATVEFATHEQANQARTIGTRTDDGVELNIAWRGRLSRSDSSHTAASNVSSPIAAPVKSKLLFGKRRSNEQGIMRGDGASTSQAKPGVFGKSNIPARTSSSSPFTWTRKSPATSAGILQEVNPQAESESTEQITEPVRSKPKILFGKPVATTQESEETRDEIPVLPFRPRASRSVSPNLPLLSTQTTLSPQKKQTQLLHSAVTTTVRSGVEWVIPRSMMALTQTVCNSVSEKSALLDKRDKILRQGITRQTNIRKAQATAGTCPDMCPERERYIREERRRVHVFEMIPGTESNPQIDHNRAVKEYSRSSADQEEPLPHELRSVKVLSTTMKYMCTFILDQTEHWGDWYDFLWNRTRAIRKDITQQHLCTPESCALVEKCARFHIFCAERLCEEGPMVFSETINTENLTKCLQTLKECYDDLSSKNKSSSLDSGVPTSGCVSEAEFRAYMILMNLNDGDTLRKIQQMRSEIRASHEVRFAVAVYNALDEKNYVRFFKLVKQTNLLNASILHRYFNQMRYQALSIIIKAYSAKVLIPLEELCSLLHFESFEEFEQFLLTCGLSSPIIQDSLSSRSLLPVSEITFQRTRSQIVEQKLTGRIGDVVYGSELSSDWSVPESTLSFNEDGSFIGIIKQDEAEDDEDEIDAQIITQTILPPMSQIPNQVVKEVGKQIILEVIDPAQNEVVLESYKEIQDKENLLKSVNEQLIYQCADDFVMHLVVETLQSLQEERTLRLKAARAQAIANCIINEYNGLADETISEQIEEISEETIKEEKLLKFKSSQLACGQKIVMSLLDDCVSDMCQQVCESVYKTDVVEKLIFYQRQSDKMRNLKLKQSWNTWKSHYRRNYKRREEIREFPAGPSLISNNSSLLNSSLVYDKESSYSDISKRFKHNAAVTTVNPDGRLSTLLITDKIIKTVINNLPVDFTQICHNIKLSDDSKIVVYTPHTDHFTDWLINKLSSTDHRSTHLPGKLLYKETVSYDRRLVIRNVTPSDLNHRSIHQSLSGTTALIYVLPISNDLDSEGIFQQMLESFLSELARKPALPVLVVSPADLENTGLELYNHSKVTQIQIDCVEDTLQYTEQLDSSLHWLISHQSNNCSHEVNVNSLSEVVISYITEQFYCTVQQDLSERRKFNLLHRPVDELISHYNNCINSLINQLTCDKLKSYSLPITELVDQGNLSPDWNSDSQFQLIYAQLTKLQLPEFSSSELSPVESELFSYDDIIRLYKRACIDIELYIKQLKLHPSIHEFALYESINNVIQHAERRFQNSFIKRYPLTTRTNTSILPINIPWTDIVTLIIEYVLNSHTQQCIVGYVKLEDIQLTASRDHTTVNETCDLIQHYLLNQSDQLVLTPKHHAENWLSSPSDLCHILYEENKMSTSLTDTLEKALMDGEAFSKTDMEAQQHRDTAQEDETINVVIETRAEYNSSKNFERMLEESLYED